MKQAATNTRATGLIRTGALALIVGPSGAGKDTLIAAARSALGEDNRFVYARRVVTRTVQDPSEDHDIMTPAAFAAARADGRFLLSWEAHGLGYGIPMSATAALTRSQVLVANVSRTVIIAAEQAVGCVVVFHVTAPVDVLARRIAARGREPFADIAARIARQAPLVAGGATIIEIVNDGDPATAAAELTAELRRLADQTAVAVR